MLTILCLASRLCTVTMSKSLAALGPRPLVICGPSGSGKSTLLKRLFNEFPNTFGFSTSHTTRKPRPGETDGIEYYFVTKSEMEELIAAGEFIETAVFCDNIYGTSNMAVRKIQEKGKVCVLDIELNGVEQIRKTDLNPILIFNNPPSLDELEKRIRKRGTETEQTIKGRLDSAACEIEYGLKPGNFHKIIHNVDIDNAYIEFRDFILSELKKQEYDGIQICWN